MSATPHRQSRRGQIIVLAPVILAVLVAILTLTADVGHMFVADARLQNAADAASLAAAQVLISSRNDGLTEQQARDAAETEATAIQQANWSAAGLEVQFGSRPAQTFVSAGPETEATAVRAVAARNDASPGGPLALLFASVMGMDSLEISAPAVCEITGNIRGYRGDLSPFAVAEDRLVPPEQEMVFYGDDDGNGNGNNGSGNGNSDGQNAPGNWGLVNFDGGPNSTPELQNWILNGYQGGLEADPETGYIWVEGSPGWRAALQSAMGQRIGDSLIMLIYDRVTAQGSNCEYRIVGFFSATIVSMQMTGNNRQLTCRVDEIRTVHDVILGGAVTSTNLRKIQLCE